MQGPIRRDAAVNAYPQIARGIQESNDTIFVAEYHCRCQARAMGAPKSNY